MQATPHSVHHRGVAAGDRYFLAGCLVRAVVPVQGLQPARFEHCPLLLIGRLDRPNHGSDVFRRRFGLKVMNGTESYNGVDAEGCTRFGRPFSLSSSWNRALVKEVYDTTAPGRSEVPQPPGQCSGRGRVSSGRGDCDGRRKSCGGSSRTMRTTRSGPSRHRAWRAAAWPSSRPTCITITPKLTH